MEAAPVNSVIFRPYCACAQHARKFVNILVISSFIGLVTACLLTSPVFAADLNPTDDSQPTLPASLSGYAYYDKNQNSKMDPTDYGIAGVTIKLFDMNNLVTPVATATTDSTGKYSFPSLDAGTYAVFNTTPNGNWTPTKGFVDGASTGTVVTETSEISDILLKSLDTGKYFNFAGALYPVQLLSKRMLTSSGGNKITPVPEPSTVVMLLVAAIGLGAWTTGRRYCRK
jgi:hypothetical protein